MIDYCFNCLVEFCVSRDNENECSEEKCPSYAYGECSFCSHKDNCTLEFNCTKLF